LYKGTKISQFLSALPAKFSSLKNKNVAQSATIHVNWTRKLKTREFTSFNDENFILPII